MYIGRSQSVYNELYVKDRFSQDLISVTWSCRYIFNIESDMFSNELKYLVLAGPAVSILRESLQLLCSLSCFV